MEQSLTRKVTAFEGTCTPKNLVQRTVRAMKVVEKGKQLDGPSKKAMVLRVLYAHIEDEETRVFAQALLPELLDTLIMVDKGHLAIAARVWFCCFRDSALD